MSGYESDGNQNRVDAAASSSIGNWFNKHYYDPRNMDWNFRVARWVDIVEESQRIPESVLTSLMTVWGATPAEVQRYQSTRRNLGEEQAGVLFLQFLERKGKVTAEPPAGFLGVNGNAWRF